MGEQEAVTTTVAEPTQAGMATVSGGDAGTGENRGPFRDLARSRGFRLLIAVRIFSQTGDGLLQAGLATLFFFRPESMRSPGGVAFALAVLLLPYSLVGPFVGAVLDRVSRRNLLVYGNLVRFGGMALLVGALAGSRGTGTGAVAAEVVLYTLALLALGLMHLLLSALSAGVPLIIPRQSLLLANAVLPPAGGVATALGAVIGFGLRIALPSGPVTDVGAVATAGVMFGLAALVATRIGYREIGPRVEDVSAVTGGWFAVTWQGLATAARHLWRRRLPAVAIAVMGAHRATYGVAFMTIVLASRTLFADAQGDGVAAFSLLLSCLIAGHGVGVALTGLRGSVGARTWLSGCMGLSIIGVTIVAASSHQWLIAVGLAIHGAGLQAGKITVDTLVHGYVDDAYRGRAFAIHDSVFNSSEVIAATVLVPFIPTTGWSPAILGATCVWLLGVMFCWRRATIGNFETARNE